MKKFLIILFAFLLLIPVNVKAEKDKIIDIHLFYLSTCPHCKSEMEYLDELGKDYNIKVHKYEVTDQENNNLLIKVQEIIDGRSNNVPYTVIGNKYLIGFSNTRKLEIKNLVEAYSNNTYIDVVGGISDGSITADNYDDIKEELEVKLENKVDIPFMGEVDAKDVSIPLVAVFIGIVDGFNPCAMWVLLFLITMLLNMKDKKRMFTLGMTFILTSGLVYAAIMLAWLNIVVSITEISWIRICIGLFAIGAGIFNINNYLKERDKEDGCQVVDAKKRKKTITKIKSFTSEKNFWLAILGVIALALSVNIVELACSAGLPLLFTQILALNNLSDTQIAVNILIYITFFLIDDIIIFTVAMFTLKVTGITTKYTKWSHLIGGLIMILIGLLLVFKPEWIMLNF